MFISVPTDSPQNITTDSDVEYVDIFFEVSIIFYHVECTYSYSILMYCIRRLPFDP